MNTRPWQGLWRAHVREGFVWCFGASSRDTNDGFVTTIAGSSHVITTGAAEVTAGFLWLPLDFTRAVPSPVSPDASRFLVPRLIRRSSRHHYIAVVVQHTGEVSAAWVLVLVVVEDAQQLRVDLTLPLTHSWGHWEVMERRIAVHGHVVIGKYGSLGTGTDWR